MYTVLPQLTILVVLSTNCYYDKTPGDHEGTRYHFKFDKNVNYN